MGFFKTASIPIVALYQHSGKFSKMAAQLDDMTKEDQKRVDRVLNLISPDVLKSVAKVYNISDKVDDYVFPVPRAVTANVPNGNRDRFTDKELLRFADQHKCLVFQTFKNDPIHIEHAASDPKTARGFIPDCAYISASTKDQYVLAVAAIDTKKDIPFAQGIISGQINKFSMGCLCEAVECGRCHKIAKSEEEICSCLRYDKQNTYSDCLGVQFIELSGVENPADPSAITQYMLRAASHQSNVNAGRDAARIINQVLSADEQVQLARYVAANINNVPDSLIRLIDRIF